VGPRQVEVERREGELPGDDGADEKTDHTPEYSGDGGDAHRPVHVGLLLAGVARAWMRHHVNGAEGSRGQEQQPVHTDDFILAEEGKDRPGDGYEQGDGDGPGTRDGDGFFCGRMHGKASPLILGETITA